jgi:hypothetical protein
MERLSHIAKFQLITFHRDLFALPPFTKLTKKRAIYAFIVATEDQNLIGGTQPSTLNFLIVSPLLVVKSRRRTCLSPIP